RKYLATKPSLENRAEPVRSNGPEKLDQRLRFESRDPFGGGGRYLVTLGLGLLAAATPRSCSCSSGAASSTPPFFPRQAHGALNIAALFRVIFLIIIITIIFVIIIIIIIIIIVTVHNFTRFGFGSRRIRQLISLGFGSGLSINDDDAIVTLRVAALLAGGIGLVERSVRSVAGIRFPVGAILRRGGESSGGSASFEILLPRIGARGLGPGASEAALPLLLQPLHFQLQRPAKDHTQYNDSDLKAQKNGGRGRPRGSDLGQGRRDLHDRDVAAADLAAELLDPNLLELVNHRKEAGRFVVVWGHEASFEVVELVPAAIGSEGGGGGTVGELHGDGVPALGAVTVNGAR
ncbi:hypothetical protein TorRG33x02_030700, partial [Trema orientale]